MIDNSNISFKLIQSTGLMPVLFLVNRFANDLHPPAFDQSLLIL